MSTTDWWDCRLVGKYPQVKILTRLAGVLDYDRAVVVGEGKVLEDGAPNELLARPMGFFSALYRCDHDGDHDGCHDGNEDGGHDGDRRQEDAFISQAREEK